jgi:Undecaprenyl-phosphate glucose phosphotransferase
MAMRLSNCTEVKVTDALKEIGKLSSDVNADSYPKLADFLAVVLSGILAYGLYIDHILGGTDVFPQYLVIIIGSGILFVIAYRNRNGYSIGRIRDIRRQCLLALATWGGVILFLLVIGFVLKMSNMYSRGWGLLWAINATCLLLLVRILLRVILRQSSRLGRFTRATVIVGGGKECEILLSTLGVKNVEIEVVGVFDDRKTRIAPVVGGRKVLGTTDDLVSLARQFSIDQIIIALPLSAVDRIAEISRKLAVLPVDLRLSFDAFRPAFSIQGLDYIDGIPTAKLAERPLKHWHGVAKWLEDKIIGIFLLILFAPLMGLIALLIKLDSRGPVLFIQERFGFNNNIVRVWKFRTMHTDRADPTGATQTRRNDERVTRLGRILRALSLDELPQLFNVIRGEMSLVGPRAHPLGMKAGDRLYYDAVREYSGRHRVKPGMTGWAQINGLRGEVDTEERGRQRVVYDLHYIEHWSFWMDVKILFQTLSVVFSRKNAY